MRSKILPCLLAAASIPAHAQQPMQPAAKLPLGTLQTADATLSGDLEVQGQFARLISNVSVSANDHTAPITLARGGKVLVCSTSGLHLLRSGTNGALLFGLDRGAIEIASPSQPQDTILTPDMRFTLLTSGTFDLRLRVTREGDTCVDNHGDQAPVLQVTESFGTGTYYLAPGQHVLFEHGSVRSVVDKERSNCGCPAPNPLPTAVAGNATSVATPQQAAALNPFPVAESADLAPSHPSVPLPAPEDSVQAKSTLTYSPPGMASTPAIAAETASPTLAPPAASSAATGPPPAPPGAHSIAHAIGGFFRRIFHRKAQ